MPDILDQAAAFEERDRELALRMRDRGPQIAATGKCLCCEAPLPAPRRWCDADCRDAHQAQAKRRH